MRNERGFSLLELVVAIIIIVILYVVQAEKALPPSTDGKSVDGKSTAGQVKREPLPLRVDAEKTSMESVVSAIRTSLATEVSMRMVKGKSLTLSTLDGSNPMPRLGEEPNNYLGELSSPDLDTIEGGHWYFDLKDRTLVYMASNPQYFKTALPGPPRARFTIKLQYDDTNNNGRFDSDVDTIFGLRMKSLEPYSWVEH